MCFSIHETILLSTNSTSFVLTVRFDIGSISSLQRVCYGYLKEPSHKDGSFEYSQHFSLNGSLSIHR